MSCSLTPKSKTVLTPEFLGGDNNLGVALAPYEPHVQCVDGSIGPLGSAVPPLLSCNVILGTMFATKNLISFGRRGSGASHNVPDTIVCKSPSAVT